MCVLSAENVLYCDLYYDQLSEQMNTRFTFQVWLNVPDTKTITPSNHCIINVIKKNKRVCLTIRVSRIILKNYNDENKQSFQTFDKEEFKLMTKQLDRQLIKICPNIDVLAMYVSKKYLLCPCMHVASNLFNHSSDPYDFSYNLQIKLQQLIIGCMNLCIMLSNLFVRSINKHPHMIFCYT